MSSTPHSRRRSLLVLAVVVLGGIGIGLLGALLRPGPTPTSVPNRVVVRATQTAPSLDISRAQASLLERLVANAAETDAPEQLADFDSFIRVFKQQAHRRQLLLDRLSSDDVPPTLRLAFAGHIPSRPAQQRKTAFAALVVPLLDHDQGAVQLAAARALEAAGQLQSHTSSSCLCRFGHYRSPADNELGYLLAWTVADEGRLTWSPRELDSKPGGWNLQVLRSVDPNRGRQVLGRRLDRPMENGQFVVENGDASPHLVLAGVD